MLSCILLYYLSDYRLLVLRMSIFYRIMEEKNKFMFVHKKIWTCDTIFNVKLFLKRKMITLKKLFRPLLFLKDPYIPYTILPPLFCNFLDSPPLRGRPRRFTTSVVSKKIWGHQFQLGVLKHCKPPKLVQDGALMGVKGAKPP